MGDYGSFSPMDNGSGKSGNINVQPPLPADEMK